MSKRNVVRVRQAVSVTVACLLSAVAAAVELDPDYGTAGIVSSSPGAGSNEALGIRVAPDGKIVQAGTNFLSGTTVMALARYNADGTPDNTFSGDGALTINPCLGMAIGYARSSPNLLAIQPDGKLVFVSSCWDPAQSIDIGVVIRLTTAGALDITFGNNGVTLLPSTIANRGTTPTAVAITDDGEILVAGAHAYEQADPQGFVMRLTASGGLDNGFANGEHLGPTESRFNVIRILADDRIMLGGWHAVSPTTLDLMVDRLLVDGAPDPSLNGTGSMEFNIGTPDATSEACTDLVVRANGSFLCAGGVQDDAPGAPTRAFVVQFNDEGELDTAWGEDGFFFPEQQVPADESMAFALTLRTGGDVFVAGLGHFPTQLDVAGEAIDLFAQQPNVSSAVVQADGMIVASFIEPLAGDFLSLRFVLEDLPAGDTTPDPFLFDDVVGTPYSTWIESEEIQITGLTSPASVTMVGGEFSIGCDGTFNDGTVATTIEDGEWICVRHRSGPAAGFTTTSTLTIGGVEGTFSSTTGDATPDVFSFDSVTNVARSSVQTSSTATITGIDIPVPISVVGGEYSFGCDPDGFTDEEDVIFPGESVCVRHTASATGSTTTSTVLTVGSASVTFSSTTAADSNVTPGGGGAGEPGDIGGGWNGGVGGSGSFDGLMLLGLLLSGGVMLGRRRQRHN